MNILFKWIASFVIIIGILVGALSVFNTYILRSEVPTAVKTLTQLMFPPNDLYNKLAETSLDSNKLDKINISLSHKYSGRYQIGLLFSNFDSGLYWNKKRLDMEIDATCFLGNNILLKRRMTDAYPFLSKEGGGYALDVYSVPNDLPLDELVTCELIFLKFKNTLFDKLGNTKLYVQKFSDL